MLPIMIVKKQPMRKRMVPATMKHMMKKSRHSSGVSIQPISMGDYLLGWRPVIRHRSGGRCQSVASIIAVLQTPDNCGAAEDAVAVVEDSRLTGCDGAL